MAPDPLPRYVYKIVASTPPTPIPDQYPLSELDKEDGFVHLSTASQVPITAGLYFTEATSLWVLRIAFSFADRTTWDGGDGCPHLHGNFGAAEVDAAKLFRRGPYERWDEAIGKEAGWLIG